MGDPYLRRARRKINCVYFSLRLETKVDSVRFQSVELVASMPPALRASVILGVVLEDGV